MAGKKVPPHLRCIVCDKPLPLIFSLKPSFFGDSEAVTEARAKKARHGYGYAEREGEILPLFCSLKCGVEYAVRAYNALRRRAG